MLRMEADKKKFYIRCNEIKDWASYCIQTENKQQVLEAMRKEKKTIKQKQKAVLEVI